LGFIIELFVEGGERMYLYIKMFCFYLRYKTINLIHLNNTLNKLKIIDFFCGAGGFSKRLKIKGLKPMLHVDMNNNV
jgi:2-polyprenyl-3-methyl-5-hydroxy-6-metoxy-1,4-benzoquinol methylase